ncbi:hypothetical protein [Methylobacterium aquaticum]|uniref:hypothetical protein n=1 Tax=Methylobacterium aquaticum TaxID=270351 RepID=UPI001FF05749|nr:hypothetical protein [Methylobacterium aquaticum]
MYSLIAAATLAFMLATYASGANANERGPAAGAIDAWFRSPTQSLCVSRSGRDISCSGRNSPRYTVGYSANGDAAIAFVRFRADTTGNTENLEVATFAKKYGRWAFARKIADVFGHGPEKYILKAEKPFSQWRFSASKTHAAVRLAQNATLSASRSSAASLERCAIDLQRPSRQAGERSGVSRWHARHLRNGHVRPKLFGGDQRSQIIEAHAPRILRLCGQRGNIVLLQLRNPLAVQGVGTSISSLLHFMAHHHIACKSASL